MVSSTLCPAVHILGSQNVFGRAEGIADHYWLPNSCPHTKFQPNQTKKEVKKIGYWSPLAGWSGQSKNSCFHFKLILHGFQPNIISQTKSNQNWMKNTKLEKIHYQIGRLRSFKSVKKQQQPFETHSMIFFARCYPPYQISPKSDQKHTSSNFQNI